jgi:hypothetical protein
LSNRLIETAGAHLCRVFHSSEIDAGNFARLQGTHPRSVIFVFFFASGEALRSQNYWCARGRWSSREGVGEARLRKA